MLAHIITALHSSHLTSTAFITVTLTMAVCQRTRVGQRKGEGGREGGGEETHNTLGLREIIRMQGGKVMSERRRKKTDRWLIWQRKGKDGEETD